MKHYTPLHLVALEFEEPTPPGKVAPGVYADDLAPPDECWWTVVASSGKVGIVHLPLELVDPDLERRLVGWFQSRDARRLKLI